MQNGSKIQILGIRGAFRIPSNIFHDEVSFLAKSH